MTTPDRPRVVITSDLDQTLVFSPRASARVGGALPAHPVDVIDGRVVGELADAVAAGLGALPTASTFVPATTRTAAQLRRLRLPIAYRHAVVANGGVVLVDGEPDPAWAARRRRAHNGAASVRQACGLLTALADQPWLLRVCRAEDIFAYAIVDPGALDPQTLARIAESCADIGWRSVLHGRKLYVLPANLDKASAVRYLLGRLANESGRPLRHLAAGDTSLDRAMVCAAHAGWAPAGSPLASLALPSSVRVTRHPGHRAAAQIVTSWRAEARAHG